MFGASIKSTGSPAIALMRFLGFYGACIALTWRQDLRTASTSEGAPPVAQQNV